MFRLLAPMALVGVLVPGLAGAQTFKDSLASKQCKEHTFVVQPGVSKLTIMLTLPGITYVNRHGTTDFDLRVTDPQGRKTGGWSCASTTTPNEIPGAAYDGYSASPETVSVRSTPSPGLWSVSVWSQLGSGAYAVSVDQGTTVRPSPIR
jgi:hypothetical protein